MKKILLLFLCCFTGFIFTACLPQEMRKEDIKIEENSSENIDNAKIPQNVNTNLGENVVVKADVHADKSTNLKHFPAKLKNLNASQTANLLFGNEEYEETKTGDSIKGADIEYQNFLGSKGSFLSLSNGSILYEHFLYTEKLYNYLIFGSSPFVNSYELKNNFQEKNLKGVNLSENIDNVTNLLDDIGIKNLNKPDVISLDYESLSKQSEKIEENLPQGKESLKSFEMEDEAYLLIYRVQHDGLKITDKGYLKSVDSAVPILGSRIYALVTENGLIYLKCENIYDIGEEIEISAVQPFEQILNQLGNKYEDIILDTPIEISDIELAYVPHSKSNETFDFEFTPYWIFNAKQVLVIDDEKGKNEFVQYFDIFISYETGEILETGGAL